MHPTDPVYCGLFHGFIGLLFFLFCPFFWGPKTLRKNRKDNHE